MDKVKMMAMMKNGMVVNKVFEIKDEEEKQKFIELMTQVVETIKKGFRDDEDFYIGLEDILIRGSEVVAVMFEDVKEDGNGSK